MEENDPISQKIAAISPFTGEDKEKKLKSGEIRHHIYYRCSRYSAHGHPKIRLTEKKIDEQILAFFRQIQIDDESIKKWFVSVIKAKTQSEQKMAKDEIDKLNRLITEIQGKHDRLVNLLLSQDIDHESYKRKSGEFKEQETNLSLRLLSLQQDRHENADLAVKSFELSQNLIQRWDTADYVAKRRILQILCLNLTLNGASLDIQWRKPYNIIAEGHILKQSGEDRI